MKGIVKKREQKNARGLSISRKQTKFNTETPQLLHIYPHNLNITPRSQPEPQAEKLGCNNLENKSIYQKSSHTWPQSEVVGFLDSEMTD